MNGRENINSPTTIKRIKGKYFSTILKFYFSLNKNKIFYLIKLYVSFKILHHDCCGRMSAIIFRI